MSESEKARSGAGAFMRNFALYIAAFTFIIAWLPFVRTAFDGSSYEWGIQFFGWQFSGAGFGGDYWLLPLQAALALVVLFAGFRAPGRFSYRLLIAWLAFNAASWTYGYLASPGGLVFRGDTLGVEIDMGLAAASLYAAALALAVAGERMEFAAGRQPSRFEWTGINTILAALAVLAAPVQYLLLKPPPESGTDEYGVLLTMAQWATIVFAFALGRRRRS